ncbi:MAG: hypothetical protein QOI53_4521 [Verrucomicrobiota bacterium]|jgi:hypothetical protein|nr:hypothetical protein [Verrucomicrobiota bacterium]
MTNRMTHHWFPIKITPLLFLLVTSPLYAEGPVSAPPADTKPVQELPPGTQPAATPSDPGQTTPLQPGATRPTMLLSTSPMNDAARYLAGLPVATGSKIAALTQQSSWQAHARAMNQAFSQLEQRQLNNIRVFRAENIAPVTQQSHTCVYLFSGPDFLYADAMFSDCSTFVLQGLEPVVPLPDLSTVPPAALAGTLQNIETSLNTILSFSFFKTKDMRENFEHTELKGVLPALAVFMARTGKEIKGIDYLSLDKAGAVVQGFQGGTRGAKITFVDTATGTEKVLYYFTSDLSDDAIKRNPGLLRFCEGLGPFNSLLKAASYLLHEGGFETVRNFLLQNSNAVLEDDSGIPVHFFSADHWTLRFFGIYTGPIDLFKKFYQPDLRQLYTASSPKPLTFGFGYRWSSRTSTMFLAVRK